MPYLSREDQFEDGNVFYSNRSLAKVVRENLPHMDDENVRLGLFATVVVTGKTEAEVIARAAEWSKTNGLDDAVILGTWFKFKADEVPDCDEYEMAFVLEG